MLNILWFILIILLFISGMCFSKKIEYRNYKIKFNNINKDNLLLSLGTKMGVGTLIGISMALYIGGPGSILWMYIFTIITSSIIYVESIMGNRYRKLVNNEYISGIYYYTKFGLKKNKLALVTLILFILTYSFLFLMIQTNTITSVLNVNKCVLFIIIIILNILIVTNDLREIRKIINKIVPIMCLFFIVLSTIVIINNIDYIPNIILNIIRSAFNRKSLFTGMIIGIKRSIFLNELLIGTTSMSSGINNDNEINKANTLILGTYFVTFIISTLVSFLILIFLYKNNVHVYSYMDLLIKTFLYHFNEYGMYYLSLLITLLATSTIISGIYIGISNISYITKNKLIINIFKSILLIIISLGTIINTNIIWEYLDIIMFIIISLNLYILFKLRNKI